MNMIKKINNYFFVLDMDENGNETEIQSLSLHDATWFYGLMTLIVVIVLLVATSLHN